MNQKLFAPALIALVALAVFLWPKAPNNTPANPSTGNASDSNGNTATSSGAGSTTASPSTRSTTLQIAPLVLSGVVDLGQKPPEGTRVLARVNGQTIAEADLENDSFRLELPSKITLRLNNLSEVKLPHGDGRLTGEGTHGANVQFFSYQDANNNHTLEPEEPNSELVPFAQGKEYAMRGFFRYRLILTDGAAKLQATQDSATGAKDYYRYDVAASGAGYHMLEGELTGGYDVRMANAKGYDLVIAPLPGKQAPALER